MKLKETKHKLGRAAREERLNIKEKEGVQKMYIIPLSVLLYNKKVMRTLESFILRRMML